MIINTSGVGAFRHDFNYLEEVYQNSLEKHLNNSQDTSIQQSLSSIDNGTKILANDEQINTYIAFYGAQHYYKLTSAFDMLDVSKFVGKPLEIISYGCGPATDVCALISYMNTNNISLSINTITLIEPSDASLTRGTEYVQSSLANQNIVKINKINKSLDDLDVSDITSQNKTTKLHFFSNILDIPNIDLNKLCNLLNNSQKGANYFVCISPTRYGGKERIDDFYSIISNIFLVSDISVNDECIRGKLYSMKKRQFEDNYYIDRYHRIFMAYID